MIVSELIELLNQFSPSAEVEFSGDDGETPIDDVEEENDVVYLIGDDDAEGEEE